MGSFTIGYCDEDLWTIDPPGVGGTYDGTAVWGPGVPDNLYIDADDGGGLNKTLVLSAAGLSQYATDCALGGGEPQIGMNIWYVVDSGLTYHISVAFKNYRGALNSASGLNDTGTGVTAIFNQPFTALIEDVAGDLSLYPDGPIIFLDSIGGTSAAPNEIIITAINIEFWDGTGANPWDDEAATTPLFWRDLNGTEETP